jgi:tRNA pseudouridine38-40 synthase
LHLVGIEKLSATDICDILNAKDRNVAGPTAPAHGLYLTKVDYNNNLDIMEWLDKE